MFLTREVFEHMKADLHEKVKGEVTQKENVITSQLHAESLLKSLLIS